jgi:hypothetical protein
MHAKLLIIPVVHSEAEMGSLRNDISEIIDDAFGREKRDKHRKDVFTFWENLRKLLEKSLENIDMANVMVYQDGIPVGGELGIKLVKEGAKDGIPNHQVVLSLIKRGAILEKTEDPGLLKEEYEILKEMIGAKTSIEREKLAEKYKKRLYQLTEERDRYIAGRITETLGEGTFGILFIGATHNILPYLSPEIDVFVCNYVERDIVEWMSK